MSDYYLHFYSAIYQLPISFSTCLRIWPWQYLSMTAFSFLKNLFICFLLILGSSTEKVDFFKAPHTALNSFLYLFSPCWLLHLQTLPLLKVSRFHTSCLNLLWSTGCNFQMSFCNISKISFQLKPIVSKNQLTLFLLNLTPRLHPVSQWMVMM